jgi:hypothetical protein
MLRLHARNFLPVTLGQVFRRGQEFRLTPDAIRQRGAIFQFLKVNKTANESKS